MARNRRVQNYWEPIFDPDEQRAFPLVEAHENRTGFLGATVNPEALGRTTIKTTRFESCDFFGTFYNRFDNCDFELCDFGLCKWRFAKFRNCRFRMSSLTQSTFENCEFRGCTWENIGISGNETSFKDTKISNPKSFVRAAYTNKDSRVLAKFGTNADYQEMRLEYTKANVARNLLNCLSQQGEESWYYEAVEIYNIQSFRAPRFYWSHQARQKANYFSKAAAYFIAFGFWLEQTILQFLGTFNKWGGSLLRPAIFGICLQILFASIYRHWSFVDNWLNAVITSVDISIVVGYTKYANTNISSSCQLVYLLNMLLGVFWFAIIVPTLINRISRVR